LLSSALWSNRAPPPDLRSPELFQLLATFALTLVLKDLALWFWGAEDLLGPRAPGLRGSVLILGAPFPEYDLVLIAVGPAVLGALWLLLYRTRWGRLVRAATQDRDMVAALGVNQKWLFTGVFALGAALAGLGGALEIPREPAQLSLDNHRDLPMPSWWWSSAAWGASPALFSQRSSSARSRRCASASACPSSLSSSSSSSWRSCSSCGPRV